MKKKINLKFYPFNGVMIIDDVIENDNDNENREKVYEEYKKMMYKRRDKRDGN